jgi:hypothetical protein
MRTLTLDEADQVTGGHPVAVAIIGGFALIIAAIITSCGDDGAKEPTVVVNCGPSTPMPGK